MMSPRSLLFSSRPRSSVSTSSTITTTTTTTSCPTYRHTDANTTTASRTSSTSTVTIPARTKHGKHVGGKSDVSVTVVPVRSVSSSSSDFDAAMGKRKDRLANGENRQTSSGLAPSSPPNITTTGLTRPATPSSPVQIPSKTSSRASTHLSKRHSTHHRRKAPRHAHTPDSLSPSMAALLAVTDIPRPRKRRDDKPLTVDDIVRRQQVAEKEFSLSFSPSPMDMLLSPPNDLDDDTASDINIGSAMTRTISADSIPSLGNSSVTDMVSSIGTPRSESPSSRGRRASPIRKSLEPVHSYPGTAEEHPLAIDHSGHDALDFGAFEPPEDAEAAPTQLLEPFKPFRSVFKSNLTASLRALRSAARSFSNLNFPTIPPDDFLTRSILTIDPNVPYTDERRPPVTEEMPSAEMRRYLNPTTCTRDAQPASTKAPGSKPPSIQMQTYKVHRSRSASPASGRAPYPQVSPQSATNSEPARQPTPSALAGPPAMRQREMRENSDFIRIAVMEMAMRKRGKLDGQRPGRARWALPPRKMAAKPYEVGPNGVPARWTPINYAS